MAGLVYYGKSDVLAEGTNSDIDTAEEDICVLIEQGCLAYSQLSAYIAVALGSHTMLQVRVYALNKPNGTWHQLMRRNISTGVMEGDDYVFDTDTPTSLVADLPLSACFGIKFTGQGIGGANATATVRLLGRGN